MQFKHPEILYFLFLLAIPIIVHLFQLRRFKKEYFTNVRFLKELSIQTRKSSKIKKYLLLASRLLLLAALIFAFAQPFFNAPDQKNATNELYVVLDNSFSMQAKGKKGELLKRTVEDLLEHMPQDQQFSLLTNSDAFWDVDIKSVRKDLQNVNYSAIPFDPQSAMAKLMARKTPFSKDVIVISDAVGLQAGPAKSFKNDLNKTFVIPEAEQKNNVSVDSVYIRQTTDKFYELGVDIRSFGERSSDVPIALYDKGKLVAKMQAKLDTKKKSVTFTIPKQDFDGFVSVSDNGLEYDNTYYFSIAKPQKIDVLSIGDPGKADFLAKIYTHDEFNYSNFDLSQLDYNQLEKQDLIVLNELRELPQALQTTLKSFVENGGNLAFIPAAEANLATMNTFVAGFANASFSAIQSRESQVTKITFNNPLYSGVFEKKIENFQYPKTKATFEIKGNAPAALAYDNQSTFLATINNRISSVYIFAAPINKENSNFRNSPLIVPTFYNMALNSSTTGVSAVTIGDDKPLIVDAALAKDEIIDIRNQNEKFIPVQQVLNNKVRLTFNGYPQQAGNFTIFKQNQALKSISFNYQRTESDLFNDGSSLLSDYKIANSVDDVLTAMQTGRTDNEIWKWFAVLALLFLLAEVLIQKFVK